MTFSSKTEKQYYNSTGCGVWHVFRYLYPNNNTIGNDERIYDAKLQLFDYAKLINNHLKHVIEGDFSWLEGYLKECAKENKLFMYVLSLDNDHPLSKRFWSLNGTWQEETERYLKDNNITL
jgi:hypothetical protein